MRAILTLGSIYEFERRGIYRYLHYVHETELNVPLVGLLKEVRQFPVSNISEIGNISYCYFVLYHLAAALKQKLIRSVGLKSVPDEYRKFPSLRVPGRIDANGAIKNWFVYKSPLTFNYERIKDNAVRYKVDQLSDIEKKLSIGSIINNARLLEMIDSDWKPEKLSSQYGRTAGSDQ